MSSKLQSLLFALVLIASFYYWGAYFAATILALSFLIFFHELGHFIVAKLLGVAVN